MQRKGGKGGKGGKGDKGAQGDRRKLRRVAVDSRAVLASPESLPAPSTHPFKRVFINEQDDGEVEAASSWDDACLPSCFKEFNAKAGHSELRPVQARLWPLLLAGRNVMCIAPTGSGKTLAYALPLVPHVLASTRRGAGPVALVLAPTRELVAQIAKVCAPFKRMFDIIALAAYGGGTEAGSGENECDVLVCTPARIVDLTCRFLVNLANVTALVIDEADRLVAMGFKEQMDWVLTRTRADKQLCLCSATMSAQAREVCESWMPPGGFENVVIGSLEEMGADALTLCANVTQTVHVCAEHKKPRKLIRHITKIREQEGAARRPGPMLIFCTKIKTVKFVVEFLQRHKIRVASIRGDMPQAGREKALREFRAGKFTTLVATDVAARGIDLPALAHVVNYDFPPSLPQYAHRVGRAARGEGQTGSALSFFTRNLAKLAPDLVRMLEGAGQQVDHHLRRLAEEVVQNGADDGSDVMVPDDEEEDGEKETVRGEAGQDGGAEDDDETDSDNGAGAAVNVVTKGDDVKEEDEQQELRDNDDLVGELDDSDGAVSFHDDDVVNTDARVLGAVPLVPFKSSNPKSSAGGPGPLSETSKGGKPNKRVRPRGKRGGSAMKGKQSR